MHASHAPAQGRGTTADVRDVHGELLDKVLGTRTRPVGFLA
ncbi:MAG: hypothetical protein ACXVGH_01980 [Mycobacteriales bacterium]